MQELPINWNVPVSGLVPFNVSGGSKVTVPVTWVQVTSPEATMGTALVLVELAVALVVDEGELDEQADIIPASASTMANATMHLMLGCKFTNPASRASAESDRAKSPRANLKRRLPIRTNGSQVRSQRAGLGWRGHSDKRPILAVYRRSRSAPRAVSRACSPASMIRRQLLSHPPIAGSELPQLVNHYLPLELLAHQPHQPLLLRMAKRIKRGLDAAQTLRVIGIDGQV